MISYDKLGPASENKNGYDTSISTSALHGENLFYTMHPATNCSDAIGWEMSNREGFTEQQTEIYSTIRKVSQGSCNDRIITHFVLRLGTRTWSKGRKTLISIRRK